ncbi:MULTISPECIES: aspartoacylase [Vibrio]|uniref:aspartoacylase n=1 Tax=Vibrio TaxID=662 RepID=UPI002075871A|nr:MULTISPECIES: aspartoacylase [Vibrio]USD34561.1 aspartoacylase [Vibrio sp. SCSIO 43186]USD47629.1 aspartoacylase [Vibrio sp. SCSIO 43145]USD71686.1 aspartoacylase [Vibrio sp. SCSIO 43139]USD98590.1 aspartoacylase [Vibrio coralliilyticus]
MQKLNQVLVVAGTHGNELTGLYLQKLIKDGNYSVERSTFEVKSVVANPEAVKKNVRFIDVDLNRQFSATAPVKESQEANLAAFFRDQHAQVENQLIVDLHNTTSNMGATLILLSHVPFYRQMGAYVKHRMPEANVLFEDRKPWAEQPYLCSVGQYGIMLEVGAQAHSSLTYETLELMKQLLTAILDFVELHNLGKATMGASYDAYRYTEEVSFPLDGDGMRLATVHPTVCGKDFEVVKPGEPLLATFFGYDVHWQGEKEVYPHFINESAYCTSNIAMALAEKIRITL